MSDYIEVALNELFQYRKARDLDTREFAALRHNRDLCPEVENQLCALLDCTLRYHQIAYDVQGLRDRGTDVVLRYGSDDEMRYVSIQIKSYHDLREEGYLTKLKAQVLEIQTEYSTNLGHCYVMVCTDVIEDRDKVRYIKKDLSGLSWLTVVDPAYAWTFLKLPRLRIESLVQSVIRDDDAVYASAKRLASESTPLECAGILTLVWQSRQSGSYELSIRQLRESVFFGDCLRSIPDYRRNDYLNGESKRVNQRRDDDTRISELLEFLQQGPVSVDSTTGVIHLNASYCAPFEALMLDAMVRFAYEGGELLRYVFESLDIARFYGIEFDLEGV